MSAISHRILAAFFLFPIVLGPFEQITGHTPATQLFIKLFTPDTKDLLRDTQTEVILVGEHEKNPGEKSERIGEKSIAC